MRLVALLTLAAAVESLSSVALAEALLVERGDHGDVSMPGHAEGIPCPDGDAHDECGDFCLCLCCPGHGVWIPPMVFDSPVVADVVVSEPPRFFLVSPPSGVLDSIWRPPRA
jgi:hypothetical protein